MKTYFKPIVTSDIENMHPANLRSDSDVYFAQLARKILTELNRNRLLDPTVSGYLRDISLKSVAYFEDVISRLGLFAGFRKIHRQMFGKKLPFLTLGSDYLDDEINIEDLQFLIWIIMEESENEADNIRFMNMEHAEIMAIASIIMKVLEEEYETAPENENLHSLLHKRSYNRFSEVQSTLDWLHYDSYLSTNYPNHAMKVIRRELHKKFGDRMWMSQEPFVQTWRCNRMFYARCTPLSVKTTDWWKAITANEEIISILNTMEYRSFAYYQIKEVESAVIKISPLFNDAEILDVDRSSFAGRNKARGKKTISVSLVKFKELWYVNSLMSFAENVDELLKNEQTQKEEKEITAKTNLFMYEKIMKRTKNSQLVFFKTFKEFRSFWKRVFPYAKAPEDTKIKDTNEKKNLTLFVNQTIGISVIPDIAQIIKAPGNKLYNAEVANERGLTFLGGEIAIPLEMLEYVIENKLIPDIKINSPKGEAHGRQLIQDNIWFIIRFFQPELFSDNIV